MPTKEEIMNKMFSAISNNYDKSEGSIIYDAVVGVAIALEDGYIEMDSMIDNLFAETATSEYLEKITAELGVFRKPATKATTYIEATGTEGTVIPIGARFFVDTIYFVSIESKSVSGGKASLLVECEQEGSVGNVPAHTIVNFEPISGINAVTNPNAVTNGSDEEPDEELRERYFERVQTPATSGNPQDYINWCKEVVGVGDAKVIPLWNGNGTVKCVVINSNKRAVDQTTLNAVVTNIDDNKPIGPTVTVISASELPINISVDVDLNTGYDLTTVTTSISNALTNHFIDIAFKSDYVSYALVGSTILNVDGVIDYRNLTLNTGTSNVTIGSEQVAVVGTVDVT